MLRYIRANMMVPTSKSKVEMPEFTKAEISNLHSTTNGDPTVLNPWMIIRGYPFDALDKKEPLGLTDQEKGFLPWQKRKRPRYELTEDERALLRKNIRIDPMGRHQLRELLQYNVVKRNGDYWVNSVCWPSELLSNGRFSPDAECYGISPFDPMMGPIYSDNSGITASLFLQRMGLWPSIPWNCNICTKGTYR